MVIGLRDKYSISKGIKWSVTKSISHEDCKWRVVRVQVIKLMEILSRCQYLILKNLFMLSNSSQLSEKRIIQRSYVFFLVRMERKQIDLGRTRQILFFFTYNSRKQCSKYTKNVERIKLIAILDIHCMTIPNYCASFERNARRKEKERSCQFSWAQPFWKYSLTLNFMFVNIS